MPFADEQERIPVRLELPRSVVEAAILAALTEDRDIARDRERLARIIVTNRQRRQAYFPSIAFGEPSWDMILHLYLSDISGQPIDVSSLCASSGAPKTTALRHLDKLTGAGLVKRIGDATDARRIFVRPDDALRERIGQWFDRVMLSLDVCPP